VGRLAGGIAHDFNNLLQVVTGHAERLAAGLPAESALQKSALEIRTSASRAAQLTDRLLSLGQRQVLEPRSIDVPRLVADLRNAIQRRVGSSVTLMIRRGRRGRAGARRSHAADPRAGASGGQRARGDAQGRPADHQHRRPRRRRGDAGRSAVAARGFVRAPAGRGHRHRDGRGDGRTRLRAVSSPPNRRGTALVWAGHRLRLVKQSNGFVWVESAPKPGRAVVVLLPVDATPGDGRATASAAPVVAIPAPDLPRVLLVEDEGAVRELLSSALERNGFDVVTAGSAEEALTLASPAFQILLSDISLPGMSGVQLARQLRRSLPSLRVLLMSGYAREEFASGRMRWTTAVHSQAVRHRTVVERPALAHRTRPRAAPGLGLAACPR
jgi:two-component system cell cycle sensor histidine kinase/response regulator CckA